MTQALTPTERQELLAKIDGLNERIVGLEREERAHREKIVQLDEDVANGKPGAKAAAVQLDDKARAARLEIDACQRAQATTQRRWADDQPFRDAEREADQKLAREEACRVIWANAKDCDQAARLLATKLLDFHLSLEPAVAVGVDAHVQHQMLLQYTFEPMLVAAGFGTVRQEWSNIAPRTLESAAREQVRP